MYDMAANAPRSCRILTGVSPLDLSHDRRLRSWLVGLSWNSVLLSLINKYGVKMVAILCPRLGAEWIGWISWLPRSILRPKHRTYYRSGRPVIKIGPKGALGSHEIRPIHSSPSLGQSITAFETILNIYDIFAQPYICRNILELYFTPQCFF